VFSTEPGVTLQLSQVLQSLQEEHFTQEHPDVQDVIVSQFESVGICELVIGKHSGRYPTNKEYIKIEYSYFTNDDLFGNNNVL